MKRLSSLVGIAWESDVTTIIGVLLVFGGLGVYVFGAHFGVPVQPRDTAGQALISLGALLITPRQPKV